MVNDYPSRGWDVESLEIVHDTVPYYGDKGWPDAKKIARLTDLPINVVTASLEVLLKLGWIVRFDDGTFTQQSDPERAFNVAINLYDDLLAAQEALSRIETAMKAWEKHSPILPENL